jgi:glycogen operon protein
MILAGDEVLRSQRGNNNAYCQDNELSWFDWRLVEANGDMLRFVRELIALRKRHPSLRRRRFLSRADIAWHGERLDEPPWDHDDARLLAFTLAGASPGEAPLHVILTMHEDERGVAMPPLAGRVWRRAVDTSLAAPHDVVGPGEQAPVAGGRYLAQPRSVVVLEAG